MIEMTQALSARLQTAKDLLSGLSVLRAATATAQSDLATANGELSKAMDELGSLEATAALQPDGTAPSAELKAARKRVSAARESLDSVQARQRGLQARMDAQRAALVQAGSELEAEHSRWAEGVIAAEDRQTSELVSVLRQRLREHSTALAAVSPGSKFGNPSAQRLARFFAPDPDNPLRNMLAVNEAVPNGSGAWGEALPYVADESLRRAFSELSGPRVVIESISTELKPAE